MYPNTTWQISICPCVQIESVVQVRPLKEQQCEACLDTSVQVYVLNTFSARPWLTSVTSNLYNPKIMASWVCINHSSMGVPINRIGYTLSLSLSLHISSVETLPSPSFSFPKLVCQWCYSRWKEKSSTQLLVYSFYNF